MVIDLLSRVGVTNPAVRARQYPHQFSGGMCQRVMIAIAIANNPRVLVADEPTTAVDVTIQAQLLELLHSVTARGSNATVLVSHDLGVIAQSTQRVAVLYGGRIMEEGPTAEVLTEPKHPYTQGLLRCRPRLNDMRTLNPIAGSPPSPKNLPVGCPFHTRCPFGVSEARCKDEQPLPQIIGSRSIACHFAGATAFEPGKERKPAETSLAAESILEARKLSVSFKTRSFGRNASAIRAVDEIDISIRPGEALGLVGESGSGKSTTARALIGLLERSSGAISLRERELSLTRRSDARSLRNATQIVFQDPFHSMNPRLSVGANAAEPLRVRNISAAKRRERVLDMFREVGLGESHYDRMPAELSGGQLQRVGIARALVVEPEVLILDEPVSSLDVSIQAQILNLLAELKERRRLAYLLISHDLSVVQYLCDRIAVMYLGRIVECASTHQLFNEPQHPYTRGLIDAIPEVDKRSAHQLLQGEQQTGQLATTGCTFRPRCRIALPHCAQAVPPLTPSQAEPQVACFAVTPPVNAADRQAQIQK